MKKKQIIVLSITFLIEKKLRKKIWIYLNFRSDPDPLFHEPDPPQNKMVPQH